MKTNYTPKNLKRWTRPQCYIGEEWPEYYSAGFGQSRDSGCLERSNFEVAQRELKAIEEPADWPHDDSCWTVVRESHWAVGWVEWIAIHQDAAEHLKCADSMVDRAENYPVLDENHFCELEWEEANEVWANCFNVHDRILYIREHANQFEFRSMSDMLGCVRGKYFAGYASELLN